MELFAGLIVLLLLGLIFGLPIASMVIASRARRLAEDERRRAEGLEEKLRWLYDTHKGLERRLAALEAKPPAPLEDTAPSAPATEPATATAPAAPDASTTELDLAAKAAAAKAAAAEAAVGETVEPEAAPAPRAPEPPKTPPREAAPPPPREPAVPLEQRLAAWLTRVGAAVALLGVLYFYKYAIDSNLIGPTGRVAVGVAAGVVALGLAEWLRATTQAAFVQILVGVGLGCLFASAWAAAVLYALISVELGFAANAVVLLAGGALAWHHRGQAILVLSLIAVFLNPVLLSTGVDRPFALFAYLLVFAGVMLAIAVQLRFEVAVGVAVLGVCAIFAGWHERYFHTYDLRGVGADRPEAELLGAYHELSARVVPLVFVALFAAEWLTAAFRLRRDGARGPVPLALAALLLLHAGWAALLYDQPLVLGGAMILAGGAGIAALGALERTDLLMVPMLAAFVILAANLGHVVAEQQLVVLSVLGLWSAVYVVAFLRSAAEAHQQISRGAAIRGAVVLGVFTLLAAVLLLEHHRITLFSWVVVGVTLMILALAHRAALAALGATALVLAFLLLLGAVGRHPERPAGYDPALLASVIAWSLLHAGGVLLAARGDRAVGWLELLSFSLAILGGVFLSVAATSESVPTLRALVVAGAGVIELGAAVYVRRARPALSGWVSILAAQALGLFATAMAFALTGATITVVWAVLTLVAALIWAKDESPAWAVALAVLASATLIRLLGEDVEGSRRAAQTFLATGGRFGVYRLDPVWNARAFALVGTGLAFLGSAFGLSRAEGFGRRAFAGALAVAGHLLLIGCAIVELRALVLELPAAPPMVLDPEEASAFRELVYEALSAQRGRLAVVVTLTLAGGATTLLAIGFLAKDAFHRYLGLAIFVVTVAKLVGWDVWQLARTYQIIVLTVVGVLLLASGFLYARLRTLFGGGAKAALLLCALGIPATSRAGPLETHTFEKRRAIDGVSRAADHVLTVDAELYAASLSEGLLDDVRIAGPDGAAVPHLVREVVEERGWRSEEGRIFDPGVREDGAFSALFEVPNDLVFCRIELSLEGALPYLRRADVETGESSEALRVVTSGALVYAIYGEAGVSSQTSVRIPRSRAPLVRISLRRDAESGETTRIQGARFFACAPDDAPQATDELPLTIVSTSRDEEKKRTILELDAGVGGLPIIALTLDTGTEELVRRVEIRASEFKSAWPLVCVGYVSRVADPRAPVDSMSLQVGSLRKRWIRLSIDDGDDAPLAIRGVSATLRRRQIVFRARAPGAHTLYVGDKRASGASYDLADIYARRAVLPPLEAASLGPLEPNPSFGRPEAAPELPLTERHRGPIGIALGVVLLGLAAYAVRILRGPSAKA